MNKAEANKKAKEVFEEWANEKETIEKKAKADGIWNEAGLDTNNHLFKEADEKAKRKLKKLKSMIDELNDRSKMVDHSTQEEKMDG